MQTRVPYSACRDPVPAPFRTVTPAAPTRARIGRRIEPGLSHCAERGTVFAMTTTHPTAPRSNGWINARRTIRRCLTCATVVVGLTVAGYVPGVVAVAALAHRGMLP